MSPKKNMAPATPPQESRVADSTEDSRVAECEACDGSGIIGPASYSVTAVDDHQTCPICKGSGEYLAHNRFEQGGGGTNRKVPCPCPASKNVGGGDVNGSQLTVGSLFAGIGGFDLGFERAGMRTKWQCELDPFCRRVLEKHWPHVTRYSDVTKLHNPPYVDVLCGGFPCQDISVAGRGAGITGSRSGLWSEFARLIGEVGPRYVVVENVPALRKRGLETVLQDLAACGYDAEWDGVPACALGAHHERDRFWLVAYACGAGLEGRTLPISNGTEVAGARDSRTHAGALADTARDGEKGPGTTRGPERERAGSSSAGGGAEAAVADSNRPPWYGPWSTSEAVPGPGEEQRPGRRGGADGCWATEPDVGRVAYGIPDRLDRLAALGNALIPQIAQWIGERIVNYEKANRPPDCPDCGNNPERACMNCGRGFKARRYPLTATRADHAEGHDHDSSGETQ